MSLGLAMEIIGVMLGHFVKGFLYGSGIVLGGLAMWYYLGWMAV